MAESTSANDGAELGMRLATSERHEGQEASREDVRKSHCDGASDGTSEGSSIAPIETHRRHTEIESLGDDVRLLPRDLVDELAKRLEMLMEAHQNHLVERLSQIVREELRKGRSVRELAHSHQHASTDTLEGGVFPRHDGSTIRKSRLFQEERSKHDHRASFGLFDKLHIHTIPPTNLLGLVEKRIAENATSHSRDSVHSRAHSSRNSSPRLSSCSSGSISDMHHGRLSHYGRIAPQELRHHLVPPGVSQQRSSRRKSGRQSGRLTPVFFTSDGTSSLPSSFGTSTPIFEVLAPDSDKVADSQDPKDNGDDGDELSNSGDLRPYRKSHKNLRDLRRQRTHELARTSHVRDTRQEDANCEVNSPSRLGSRSPDEFELFDGLPSEETAGVDFQMTSAVRLLQICGIFPTCIDCATGTLAAIPRSSYSWFIVLLNFAALVAIASDISVKLERHRSGTVSFVDYTLVSDLALSVGAIVALLSLGTLTGAKNLVNCYGVIEPFAHNKGFYDNWQKHAQYDILATVSLWIITVLERARSSGAVAATLQGELGLPHLLRIGTFAVVGAAVAGASFCMLHISRGMTSIVDTFCCQLVEQAESAEDLADAVREWNVVQAVLRHTSHSIEHCFLVLQTVAFAAVLLSVVDVFLGSFIGLVPIVILTIWLGRVFFAAAAVTDKCLHMPSLVNSLYFGEDMDHNRQYVVEYIINSAAGFYVFEVRLTSAMVLKFVYIGCVIVFALATKVLANV